jgi:glycosyltransferase involved in cell wall biosynthesis
MDQKNVLSIVLNSFTNDSRVLKEGLSLKKNNYNVTVVALHESDLPESEEIHGLPVNRIKLKSRGWPKWKPIQLLKYLEFIFQVIVANRNKVDIVHCNDLNALPVGVLLKKMSKNNLKIVYDAHEYEINDVPNQSSKSIQLKYLFEKLFIKYADQVITVSDSIANEYAKLYSITKPHLVLNCPHYQKIKKQNIFRERLNIRDDQTIFLYQGGLGKGRGIELILEVFSQFKEDENVLVCMGYGPLERMVQEKEVNTMTIFFHPAVTPEVLLQYTSSADYGISFIEDACLSYRYCLPNKIFEYLMAGLPVLTSNLFEMKRLVEAYQVGVVAKENTVDGFVAAVKASLEMDSQQIKKNVEKVKKDFCWEKQEKILLGIYKEI